MVVYDPSLLQLTMLTRPNPLSPTSLMETVTSSTATVTEYRKQAEGSIRKENLALREEIDQVFMFEEVVGSSSSLKAVLDSVRIVAPADSTVLIQGETGTGKEMIARAIHNMSPRK